MDVRNPRNKLICTIDKPTRNVLIKQGKCITRVTLMVGEDIDVSSPDYTTSILRVSFDNYKINHRIA